MRTGGVEPPQREATGLRPAELAGARRPHDVRVAGRARTGACGAHDPGCFRLHHGHQETGTTYARDPVDLRRGCGLCPRPLAHVLGSARSRHAPAKPERTSRGDRAGGIRTHDLELMRLARTAAPLPRKSGRQDSNLRSPAPEAGGVAKLPHSQNTLPEAPPAGLEPAASRLRAGRHHQLDHGGSTRSEAPESNQALLDISEPCRRGHRPPKLRRQDSNLRLASNSRASCRSTTPERT